MTKPDASWWPRCPFVPPGVPTKGVDLFVFINLSSASQTDAVLTTLTCRVSPDVSLLSALWSLLPPQSAAARSPSPLTRRIAPASRFPQHLVTRGGPEPARPPLPSPGCSWTAPGGLRFPGTNTGPVVGLVIGDLLMASDSAPSHLQSGDCLVILGGTPDSREVWGSFRHSHPKAAVPMARFACEVTESPRPSDLWQ